MAIKKIRVLDEKRKAMSVHFLTASGAVFAMFALLSAAQEHWDTMFFWLIIAFIVDGIDGSLARKFNVVAYAPRYDGSLLDLIIDYMTYAFIPAFALYWSGILSGWVGLCAIGIIIFASAIYFVDTNMKTKDNYFVGFPGCWNMFVLVVFATDLNIWFVSGAIIVLGISMFLPLNFIHPVRTKRWRPLSIAVASLWIVTALWSVSQMSLPLDYNWPFHWMDGTLWINIVLFATSAYLLCAGVLHQILTPRNKAD